jgi:hypothetical protein
LEHVVLRAIMDISARGILISLSLTQAGIQGIPDRAIAVDTAKRMNDDLAEQVLAAHPEPIRCCRAPGRARRWWTEGLLIRTQ